MVPGAEPFRFDAGPRGALLLHGFTGAPASMRPFGEWLATQGVSSVGPRLSGHGTTWEDLETATWRQWEREVLTALDDLSSRCDRVIVVGQSMGGALALHLAATNRDRLRGVAVINPLIRRPELALAPVIRLVMRSAKGIGNDIKKPGQDEVVYDRIPLRAANEMGKLLRTADRDLPSVTIPLLVFSAVDDHTVKPANSQRVIARAGSTKKDLLRLTNSYHVASLDYDAPYIFEQTLRFLDEVCGP